MKNDLKGIEKYAGLSEYGGAGLFGLKAPVIKAHGSSNEVAFYNAMRQAREMVKHDVSQYDKRSY